MRKKLAVREITIVGVVNEIEIDDSGKPVVCITADDEDYIVEMNPVGKELAELLDEEVEVTGAVTTDPVGNLKIIVSGFEILEGDYDDDRSYEDEFGDGYGDAEYEDDDDEDYGNGDGDYEVYGDEEYEEDDDYGDGGGRKKSVWDD